MIALVVAATVAASFLAAGSGVAKVVRPDGAVVALRGVGAPAVRGSVRALAVLEVVLGAVVIGSGAWEARALLAAAYAAFAAFAWSSIRHGSTAPCGCFGAGGAPAGWRHLVFDAAFAVALAATLLPGAYPADHLGTRSAAAGALVLALGACTAALAAVLMSRGAIPHDQRARAGVP